jgi:hypothetical protein
MSEILSEDCGKLLSLIGQPVLKDPETGFVYLTEESYKKFCQIPKQLAEEYNKDFDGYFYHTANFKQVGYTLEKAQEKEPSKELCVCSFDSVRIFRAEFILVGKGDLRMLFDFDCYSSVGPDEIHRYATVSELDDEKTQKSKHERVSEGKEFINSQYHDEGFIQPKDAEFFILSHAQKGKGDKEIQALLKKFPNLEWMDYSVFQEKVLNEQSWGKSVKILDTIYDKFHHEGLVGDEYDDLVAESGLDWVLNESELATKIKDIFRVEE